MTVETSFMRRSVAVIMAVVLTLATVGVAASLTGCAASTPSTALKEFPVSDMSGYACMEDYEKDTVFVTVTVKDIEEKMKAGESFAVYAGFESCPWCNVALPILNDVALEGGHTVGYIDTRANPAWNSNLDIDDYDTFVELFGSALKEDENNVLHLYVPHVFFVKDGTLVYDHGGTVSEQESPDDDLTDEQIEQLRSYYQEGFAALA